MNKNNSNKVIFFFSLGIAIIKEVVHAIDTIRSIIFSMPLWEGNMWLTTDFILKWIKLHFYSQAVLFIALFFFGFKYKNFSLGLFFWFILIFLWLFISYIFTGDDCCFKL